MNVKLAYGREGLSVEIPEENVAHVLDMPVLPPVGNPQAAMVLAMQHPIGTPPLTEIAEGYADACIVVSDITRPAPNSIILPPIIHALTEAGIRENCIEILVATGLHRPSTPEQLAEMLGPQVMSSGCVVRSHDARDADAHMRVGKTSGGADALVDTDYVMADIKVLTGLVEPHLMAGYSGGRKAICPGICAAETIMAFHRPELMESPLAVAGNLVDNPVDEMAWAVAQPLETDLIVNVTVDAHRRITGIYPGDLYLAHQAACAQAHRQCSVTVPEPVDVVITSGGGHPLDLTFYQGIKGIVAAADIVRPGGSIIIAEQNAEGIGGPEFTEQLLGTEDIHALIRDALENDRREIDLWQTHKLELVLRKAKVYNYSTGIDADMQEQLFVTPVASVEEAVERCLAEYGPDATIAVMPDGPYLLASVSGG